MSSAGIGASSLAAAGALAPLTISIPVTASAVTPTSAAPPMAVTLSLRRMPPFCRAPVHEPDNPRIRRHAYAGGMSSDEKPDAASEETKRKFREALERKKQQQHDRPGHLDAEGAVHGSQNKAGGKREFRRKSG